MKKAILVSLAISMILTYCACSSDKATTNDTKKQEESSSTIITTGLEETERVPELPKKDYEGYSFKVGSTSENTTFDIWTFDTEEQSGEVVEDAFYLRNRAVEELYNIKIAASIATNSEISKSIKAGDDAYDLIFDRAFSYPSMITGNYLTNLLEVPYLDLSFPFWDKNSVKDLSIANQLYMVAGDIHLSSFDCTWTLYFDKDIIAQQNLESPYDLIAQNKWTFDKFYDMAKGVSRDINGDGKMDGTDMWGFSTHQGTYPGLMIAAGERFTNKDKEDIPNFTMNTASFSTKYEKVLGIMHHDNVTYEQIAQKGGFESNHPQVLNFTEDRALFFSEVMNGILTLLRDKKNDYGVIPWPKYDETQEHYYNYVNESTAMMAIPITATDLERTGMITQALAYESSKTVRPAYYEIAIKAKYARDEKMPEMLDLIFENRTYDMAFIYGWGGFANTFYQLAVKNSTDLSSFLAKYEAKINKDIDKFLTAIEENVE